MGFAEHVIIARMFRPEIKTILPLCALLAGALQLMPGAPATPRAEVWTFDRLDKIGGHKTMALGSPRIIRSPLGKAVEFNGAADALFIDSHPLAGAETFTWEVLFNPYKGGNPAQRFFHLSEQ